MASSAPRRSHGPVDLVLAITLVIIAADRAGGRPPYTPSSIAPRSRIRRCRVECFSCGHAPCRCWRALRRGRATRRPRNRRSWCSHCARACTWSVAPAATSPCGTGRMAPCWSTMASRPWRRSCSPRSQKIAPGPVRVVINTHWHPDHTGGNEHVRRVRQRARGARQRARTAVRAADRRGLRPRGAAAAGGRAADRDIRRCAQPAPERRPPRRAARRSRPHRRRPRCCGGRTRTSCTWATSTTAARIRSSTSAAAARWRASWPRSRPCCPAPIHGRSSSRVTDRCRIAPSWPRIATCSSRRAGACAS